MEKMKKENIEYKLDYHLHDKNDIYEESPIKKIKKELSDSDHENKARLVTDQEQPVVKGCYEFLSKECPVTEEFGKISFKEEVSEEFLHEEMSSSINWDVLCAKSETSPPSTTSEFLQLELHRQKVTKLRLSTSPKYLPATGMSLPNQALKCDPNYPTAVSSRLNISEKVPENTIPFKSTSTNSDALHNSSNRKIYKCGSCSYQTTRKGNLEGHLRTHTGDKPFQCSLCPYQAATKGQLKQHSYDHTGEKPFKCSLCPHQAARKAQLKSHLNTHTNEKPFKCDLCPYQSATKRQLECHSYTHTCEKPFKCSVCPYQAAMKGHLKSHLHTHSGEKPFKCGICPYQAARKTDLKRHSHTHSGEKPFKCSLCTYQAATKCQLKSHSYNHTGDKPFRCNLCPYQTATKGKLKSHLLTHTNDKPLHSSGRKRKSS